MLPASSTGGVEARDTQNRPYVRWLLLNVWSTRPRYWCSSDSDGCWKRSVIALSPPVAFGSGSHSLTILTAAGVKSDVGTWLFGNAAPVNGLRIARGIAEKSPARMAAVGTSVTRSEGRCCWVVPWYDPKKNVRFL